MFKLRHPPQPSFSTARTFVPKSRTFDTGSSTDNDITESFDVSFVLLPDAEDETEGSVSGWWPCWHLPNMQRAYQFQETLYQRRRRRQQPPQQKIDDSYWLQCNRKIAWETYQRVLSGKGNASSVWLLMGRRHQGPKTVVVGDNRPVLSIGDKQFVSKGVELGYQALQNPELRPAINDGIEYNNLLQRQAQISRHAAATTMAIPIGPSCGAVAAAREQGDSATVVTTSSPHAGGEEDAASKAKPKAITSTSSASGTSYTSTESKNGRKRKRTPSPQSSKRITQTSSLTNLQDKGNDSDVNTTITGFSPDADDDATEESSIKTPLTNGSTKNQMELIN